MATQFRKSKIQDSERERIKELSEKILGMNVVNINNPISTETFKSFIYLNIMDVSDKTADSFIQSIYDIYRDIIELTGITSHSEIIYNVYYINVMSYMIRDYRSGMRARYFFNAFKYLAKSNSFKIDILESVIKELERLNK